MPARTTSLLRELVAVPNIGPASTSSILPTPRHSDPHHPSPDHHAVRPFPCHSSSSPATTPKLRPLRPQLAQAPRPKAILIVFSELKHIPQRSNLLYICSPLCRLPHSLSSTGNHFFSFVPFSTGSAMERGVRRIMVDISRWQPSPDLFHLLLSHLPTHEHSSVTRFVRLEDRKRALVSRLLQYLVVNDVLGIPFNEIDIRRTQLGKPYLKSGGARMDFPNFNFNTSHHGDFVGIASEPLCLIGLDIVSCDSPKQGTLMEFLESYSSCFTSLEWDVIINARSSAQTLGKFYRYWSLKEAYIKAIGAGLGFELKRLEFRHADWTGISIWVDGQKLTNWKFWFYELGKGHLAAVARGPPNEAIDDYKRTLGQVDLKEDELSSGLRLPSPAFTFCCIEQLVLTMNSYRKDGHLSPRIQNS